MSENPQTSVNVEDNSNNPTYSDQIIYRKKETHNQGVAFKPSWVHTVNELLTIYFVGGFFFGASLLPGKKTLVARYIITDELLQQTEDDIKLLQRKDYTLKVSLTDKEGKGYAEIEKVIYIASKGQHKSKKQQIPIVKH